MEGNLFFLYGDMAVLSLFESSLNFQIQLVSGYRLQKIRFMVDLFRVCDNRSPQ